MTYLPSELRPLPVLPPARRRRRHPVAALRPYSWWDLGTFVAYVALMFLGVQVFLLYIPGVREALHGNEYLAEYLLNLAAYIPCVVLALIALRGELWRSFITFRWYPWAKYLCIPGAWVASLIVTAIANSLGAAAIGKKLEDLQDDSANQAAINQMQEHIPFLAMAFMVVLLGPLVEEYLFRHLLIGKLSALLQRRAPQLARWLNPWVIMVISTFAFMSLHFIGKEWPTFFTGSPYVIMGLSFGIGYLLSGRSIAYSYSLHAFSNLMALVMTYAINPSSMGV